MLQMDVFSEDLGSISIRKLTVPTPVRSEYRSQDWFGEELTFWRTLKGFSVEKSRFLYEE